MAQKKNISIRFSARALEIAQEHADASGLTRSAYINELVLQSSGPVLSREDRLGLLTDLLAEGRKLEHQGVPASACDMRVTDRYSQRFDPHLAHLMSELNDVHRIAKTFAQLHYGYDVSADVVTSYFTLLCGRLEKQRAPSLYLKGHVSNRDLGLPLTTPDADLG